MLKHGKSEFNFLPRTFCLPADTKLLRKVWERKGGKGRWIVKPPALARGEGIKVINKWSQIPTTRPLIVQRYHSSKICYALKPFFLTLIFSIFEKKF